MLKSYEAIYDHGRIQWIGVAPRFKRVRVVLVADDANELEETQEANLNQQNGARLVGIKRATPSDVLESIGEKYGDPLIWQSEQRQDRRLPGREDI